MLQDLFTIGVNGKTSAGLNTFASNCTLLTVKEFLQTVHKIPV